MYICVYLHKSMCGLFLQNAVDDVRMVLVGNKIDLENQRVISAKRGKKVELQYACTVHVHVIVQLYSAYRNYTGDQRSFVNT